MPVASSTMMVIHLLPEPGKAKSMSPRTDPEGGQATSRMPGQFRSPPSSLEKS